MEGEGRRVGRESTDIGGRGGEESGDWSRGGENGGWRRWREEWGVGQGEKGEDSGVDVD